jgi:serine/threonine protein kinase
MGGELFKLLQARGSISEPEAFFYSSNILVALKTLHDAGVVYRDLKPENVMIDSDGYAKLVDLGLALFTSKADGSLI